MSRERTWREWVVDYIIETGECPGDIPSFGSPVDMLTKENFDKCIAPMKKHRHKDCHFVPEILGIGKAIDGMKEVKVVEGDYEKRVSSFSGDIKEVKESKKLVKLKENLHLYVERIHFKPNGSLSVPTPLLEINSYVNKFFSTENS